MEIVWLLFLISQECGMNDEADMYFQWAHMVSHLCHRFANTSSLLHQKGGCRGGDLISLLHQMGYHEL